jgi:hypothetical protein
MLCATAMVLPLAGCGADAGVEPVATPKAATPTPEARRQLEDPRSPAATVMRFWNSIQTGALPQSLALYEPRVVSGVGIATFSGMLNDQRAVSADARLNVLSVDEGAGGQIVGAEVVPKAGAKTRHSFFLRRVGTAQPVRYRIVYDTLSAAGVPAYVQSKTQRSIDPTAVPGRKALAAGDRAAELYREVALAPAPAAGDADELEEPPGDADELEEPPGDG